jgi:hypothetical protein
VQHIPNRWRSINSCCLVGTVACTLLLLVTTSATFGQDGLIVNNLPVGDRENSRPVFFETAVDRSEDTTFDDLGWRPAYDSPRWTASADCILLDRVGSAAYTLVGTVPHRMSPRTPATEVLHANDLQQGFAGGPRFGLNRHGDSGYDFELSYFQIDGWNAYRSIGPTPHDWLVMTAPGAPLDFLQTQDHRHTQMMAWDYASRLYNAELNVRWNACARLTLLAGFRWANLTEELQGTLPELPGTWPQRREPFWDANVRNNLYGFQVGGDGKLLERGRFSINGLIKAGIFGNNAAETAAVSIDRTIFWESASLLRAAFLGETGLQCKYQVTQRLLLKLGYEALWLQGVALAPGQIQETYSYSPDLKQTYVQALGVNCGSGVFYHGATAGLEYAF